MCSGAVTGMGRRYLILAILFVNLAVIYGAWYSYSVFLVALLRGFHSSCSVSVPTPMWAAPPLRPHPLPERNCQ